MTRSTFFLCWLVPVFFLGACATTTDPASSNVAGSSGSHSRPLFDLQPTSEEEARARVHFERGRQNLLIFGVRQSDVAMDAARMALKIKPGYPLAYHLMGLIHMELGQNAQADEAFRRALRSAPGDPDFNNDYGWFLCHSQKRVSEAMSRFATASANPYYLRKTQPHTNAGLCMLENNNLEQAEVQFLKALEADSSNYEALYRLAEVGYRRGNYRSTYDFLSQYHQRFDPSARSTWLGLRASRRLGERHAEASYREQLRSRFGDSPENALMMQGNYE
jgi:type IV pilus assembly protein PilF